MDNLGVACGRAFRFKSSLILRCGLYTTIANAGIRFLFVIPTKEESPRKSRKEIPRSSE